MKRFGVVLAGALVFGVAACGSTGSAGFEAPAGSNGSSGGDATPMGDFAVTDSGLQNPDGGGYCPNVDILFVIDNSGSMADKQQRLASSFPGFAQAIQDRLRGAKSGHVGVVSTSDYVGIYPNGTEQTCLVRRTETQGNVGASNANCLGGSPFIELSDPSFSSKFQCVAKLGAGGDSDEKLAKGFLGALDPVTNAAGKCNAGFSRPDALLVLVMITDEDDYREQGCDDPSMAGSSAIQCGSGGTPTEWYNKVIALKGGHPENVLVLSLVARDKTCANAPTVNMVSFTRKFGSNGFVGDVCMNSYDSFFSSTLPLLDKACVSYVPPK
jgi:hypothetical protein